MFSTGLVLFLPNMMVLFLSEWRLSMSYTTLEIIKFVVRVVLMESVSLEEGCLEVESSSSEHNIPQ